MTSITYTQRVFEDIHSNLLGTHINVFDPLTIERLATNSSVFGAAIGGNPALAPSSAIALLDATTRVQAVTLALADSYRLAALCALAGVALACILVLPPRL